MLLRAWGRPGGGHRDVVINAPRTSNQRERKKHIPNKTFNNTGISSEKLPVANRRISIDYQRRLKYKPAGSRYKMDFLRFSKHRRPYWIPVMMSEKLARRTRSAASCWSECELDQHMQVANTVRSACHCHFRAACNCDTHIGLLEGWRVVD